MKARRLSFRDQYLDWCAFLLARRGPVPEIEPRYPDATAAIRQNAAALEAKRANMNQQPGETRVVSMTGRKRRARK